MEPDDVIKAQDDMSAIRTANPEFGFAGPSYEQERSSLSRSGVFHEPFVIARCTKRAAAIQRSTRSGL